MKVCSSCGTQMPDENNACTNCGTMLNGQAAPINNQVDNNSTPRPSVPLGQTSAPVSEGKGAFGYAVLGFIFPIVGFVLYFVWSNSRPGDARMAGMGGLVSFAIGVVLRILASV